MRTLYKKNKSGKIQQWSIWITYENGIYTIMTSHGVVDGKIVIDQGKRISEGKNIGRANETTPEQQATSEAQSTIQKKIDEGYKTTIKEAEESNDIKPMTAYSVDKAKNLTFPKIVQIKYDGARCLISNNKGKVILKSRKGKDFYFLNHIRQDLKDIPEHIVLDGELYTERIHFQELMSIIKQKKIPHLKEKEIKFYAFDLIDLKDKKSIFTKRYEKLKELTKGKPNIKVVENEIAKTRKELDGLRDEMINKGYEGIMLRDDAKYVMGRTNSLLKYKNTEDAEFEIVGFKEAQGNDTGTVIWECKTELGTTFEVRPKGDRLYRAKLYEDAKKYLGKQLTVSYQELTPDGIPRFPVGIAIRDYE